MNVSKQANKQIDEMSSSSIPLWHLEMTKKGIKQSPRYDRYDSFIVAAPTIEVARSLAQNSGGEEIRGKNWGEKVQFWSDPKMTTIKLLAEVSTVTEAKIVLGSFNAG